MPVQNTPIGPVEQNQIFQSSTGPRPARLVRWIEKMWFAELSDRSTCLVAPCQLLTPEQAAVLEAMQAAAPGTGYDWYSSSGQ